MLIKEIINKFDKSSIKAGDGSSFGKYPLYTCSPIINKYLDTYLVDDEALVLSTGGSFSIHYVNGKFNYSTDCYAFNTNKFNLKYIYYYLISRSEDINKMFRGAGLKHLNKNEFLLLNIQERSKEEQNKIVSALDSTSSLISIKKEEIKKCDNLIKSQFVEMFGSLNNNKNNFEIVTVNDVCSLIKDGTHQTPLYTDDSINGYKFLSSKDVMTRKINWTDIKYIPKNLHDKLYSTLKPQRNDVLMSKNGVNYGVAAVNDTDEVFDIYVSLALLRPKECINPEYLKNVLNYDDTKQQFDSSIKGIGVPNLHLSEIKKTKIILPPITLQNKFAKFVEQVDKQKFEFERQLERLEVLQASLMQEYFG